VSTPKRVPPNRKDQPGYQSWLKKFRKSYAAAKAAGTITPYAQRKKPVKKTEAEAGTS